MMRFLLIALLAVFVGGCVEGTPFEPQVCTIGEDDPDTPTMTFTVEQPGLAIPHCQPAEE